MSLIDQLQNPACYPHPVTELRLIETHISWLILTGETAYKLKKPVNFGFLDFTTLAQRKHYCEEEIRLNRRLAPDIYQQVVAIYGSPEAPRFQPQEPDEQPIEYAVQMQQFDDHQRLDLLLQAGQFRPEWSDHLATDIARFHQALPVAGRDNCWGTADTVKAVVFDNFHHIRPLLTDSNDQRQLKHLHQQMLQQFQALKAQIQQRKAQGFVRECHGDLHLANITRHQGQLRLFDCIEFNLQFRWIDTLCDLAFLLMDLEANGQYRTAARLLNLYLEQSGDYEGLPLLNFYKAYRAMVRAKVATLATPADLDAFRRYLSLARQYTHTQPPFLLLMQGVSGSGKSTLSAQLSTQLGLIRVRADTERKRLHRQHTRQGTALELYGPRMNHLTYARQRALAACLLKAGHAVVVDATFIRRQARQGFLELAQQQGVPIRILRCDCDTAELERRLIQRTALNNDISDATVTVMHDQLNALEPPADEELAYTLAVETQQPDAVARLVEQLQRQGVARRLSEHYPGDPEPPTSE